MEKIIKDETANCRVCKKDKTIENFEKHKHTATGYLKTCKQCAGERKHKKLIRQRFIERQLTGKGSEKTVLGIDELAQFDIEKEIMCNGKIKHFTSLFVAQSESGKTVLMMHLLKKLRDHYDIFILISKNIQAEAYDLSKFHFYTNESNLQKVIYACRYLQRLSNNKLNLLIVVDDIRTRSRAAVQDLFTNGRNSNISTMNLVQHPTMVDNHIRTNCKFIFLFHQKNPELIQATTKKFLNNFVKIPPEYDTRIMRQDFLENWLQTQTKDFTSVVLNIKSGLIQKIRANI